MSIYLSIRLSIYLYIYAYLVPGWCLGRRAAAVAPPLRHIYLCIHTGLYACIHLSVHLSIHLCIATARAYQGGAQDGWQWPWRHPFDGRPDGSVTLQLSNRVGETTRNYPIVYRCLRRSGPNLEPGTPAPEAGDGGC